MSAEHSPIRQKRKSAGPAFSLPPEGQRAVYVPEDMDAYSINEFCARHRISVPFYYKLRSQGLGPDEMKLGVRVLISREAATRWRAAREQASQAAV